MSTVMSVQYGGRPDEALWPTGVADDQTKFIATDTEGSVGCNELGPITAKIGKVKVY